MQIQIIHDPLRTDRYELLQKEIAEHNLDVKLWDAVKGIGKPKQNISEAHKRIVRWGKENSMNELLIGEDDFHLVCNGAFEYFLSKKPDDYDLYFAGIIGGRINPDNTLNDPQGMQLYFIHSRYYDTFLEADPNRDIDRAQFDRQWKVPKGKFVCCVPFAVTQHETYSDNTKIVHKNSRLYKNREIYAGQ